jgi:hypothetical protein
MSREITIILVSFKQFIFNITFGFLKDSVNLW